MTATAGEPGGASKLVSPCIGICLMDPATRTCRGCLRTIEEIAGWYDASIPEKQAILTRLAARRREADRR